LFTQPEEREYLDYLREELLRTQAEAGFDIEEAAIPEIPDATPIEEAGPVEVSFGGIMTRRDGSRRIWLDGKLLEESALPSGVSVGDSSSLTLRVTQGNTVFLLRPGQTVDLTTGTVMENFQRPLAKPPQESVAVAPQTDSPSLANPLEVLETVEDVVDAATALTVPGSSDDANAAANTDGEVAVDDIAGAVGLLSDEEAAALAAALERRKQENSDED
jgi:hypothetical protein